MKLLIKSEKITGKHKWDYASENYSHSCGVSHLAWCKNCGVESAGGYAGGGIDVKVHCEIKNNWLYIIE